MSAMFAQQSAAWKAYAALISGLLIIGFSAIFVRAADAPGMVTGFYRMGIGTLILTIPFLLRLRRRGRLAWDGIVFAAAAGVFFGADLSAWMTGIALSGATLPTLFGNTAPLWVGLGAWLLFKEQLGALFWLGLGLALAGASLILGLDLVNNLRLDPGSLLGLLSGFFYGCYFLVSQPGRKRLDALSFFWTAGLFSTLTLLATSLLFGHALTGYSSATYLNFIAQGVIIQAAGWLLLSYAQGYLPASIVAATLLGQPVLTAALAVPLLGEFLRPVEIFGGLAVLAGILLVHRSRRPKLDIVATP
jgi:drug/metabolite transporter (DMT)-like permease